MVFEVGVEPTLLPSGGSILSIKLFKQEGTTHM